MPETLDSLLAQTYLHWECLIIDDGSTDNSRAIGEAYAALDDRFRYFYQANKGMSAARNRGLDEARGEYIQLLDADDLLAPRKLVRQVALLKAHPAVDLVYGDARFFRHGNIAELSQSSDMLDHAWMSQAEGEGEPLVNAIVETSLMVVHAPLTRASLMRRVGHFAEDLRSAEDWEFWVRCALAGGNFRYDGSPDAWALVRVHPTSTSQNARRFQEFEIIVRERLKKKLAEKRCWKAVDINATALENSHARLAGYHLTHGNAIVGIIDFVGLAYSSGKYRYYLRSIGYCLKLRLRQRKAHP